MDNEEIIQDKKDFQIKAKSTSKSWIVFLSLGSLFLVAAIALFVLTIAKPKEELADLDFPILPTPKTTEAKIYDTITGREISDIAENNSPVFCMQTPNGLDGARPQAGLNEAKVVFEAIAEAGITRFAAIYQNPQSAIIGPIRSLRLYYLQWDTPFDCTITHAGGAYDAIEAVRYGHYKDLTESYQYMYRGTIGARRWNNLFTTSHYLKQFADDNGFSTSNPTGFTRLTPEQAENNRIDTQAINKLRLLESTTSSTMSTLPRVTNITIKFGNINTYNPTFTYNADTNTYDRSYVSGGAHEVYNCPEGDLGEKNPEAVCELKQLSPSVVIAMTVQEKRASDNYHEDITTTGSGTVRIYQNGTSISGTWQKNSVGEQIKFFDEAGNEVALVPGQTWIAAVPQYGSVEEY